MPNNIPENARHLIFEKIDSVEQLEVLLFLRSHSERSWTSTEISKELRSSPQSVLHRLTILEQDEFLQSEKRTDGTEVFRYKPVTSDIEDAVNALAEAYRVRPHKVLEVIFSPLKKGRYFADAFLVTKSKKGKDNG